jgi:hypothetical protein
VQAEAVFKKPNENPNNFRRKAEAYCGGEDNMSGPLRKIKEQISSIQMTPGMQAATGWMKSLGNEAKNFATNGGNVAGVMDSIGIGGLAAVGSLAAVVEHMRALGQRSLDMKELVQPRRFNGR